MSYDLHVIAKRQPKAADLSAFLDARDDLRAEGQLKRNGFVLVTGTHGTHAEVDGPSRLEPEDVPDAANGSIGPSGWLVQISVKPSTDATWPMDLAVHLARQADGVVYDPQDDRVAWPKGFQPRDPESGEERGSQVALHWFTTRDPLDPEFPKALLHLMRTHFPEALPTRYGGYEPLPERFDGTTADADFVRLWLEEARSWPPMLFWSSARPGLHGSAFVRAIEGRDEPGVPVSRISVQVDGRALARDPQLNERLVQLFAAVARELGCVYAAGAVHRDMLIRRGRVGSDYRTEAGPIPFANRWIGLPAAPTWLAWFGPAYADLVRPGLAAHITSETNGALLIRIGPEPMDADQLADNFPPLPLSLIAHRIDKPPAWEAGTRYSLASGPPSQPAEHIPNLEGR
ncbi:MAG: hypothetical protein ACRDHD_04025 [Candidatus Limnocylindria bacterium]